MPDAISIDRQQAASPVPGEGIPDEEAAIALDRFMCRVSDADANFVFAVTTTGIYCRSSCPARRPRPDNVRVFRCGAHARDAGFRPCRRCRPDEAGRDRVALKAALAHIENADGAVRLAELAAITGYSAGHLQRLFKQAVGVSPAQYARQLRTVRAGQELRATGTVTDAIYEAGYDAPSRFYADWKERGGMTPSAWVKGGAGETIQWAVVETSYGAMLIAATRKGVCRLSFAEGVGDLRRFFPNANLVAGRAEFGVLLKRVIAAVEMPGNGHDIPLDVRGTAFQERVWTELTRIPPGETRTYSQLAAAAGNPRASRAAGSANGANPVAVLVPCHRVVRADGSIGGYAYGEEIKRALLAREAGQDADSDDQAG